MDLTKEKRGHFFYDLIWLKKITVCSVIEYTLSAGVNLFLDDLVSFMSELSLSWNFKFTCQNFTFPAILNKSFSNCSKSFAGGGVLSLFKP